MAFRLFSRPQDGAPVIERKASATGRVAALAAGSGRVAWSARDTGTLTRGGFIGNPVGFRAVRLIADTVRFPLESHTAKTRQIQHNH